MKKGNYTILILFFCLLTVFKVQSDDKIYTLGIGDVISITVFNENDLNLKSVKINDNGNISVPLLGQVSIEGKTIAEIEKHLTELYNADYLVEPKITVSIDEYRPFYINGEVNKPGSYPFRNGLTVEMAVTIAGGFTERASRQKVFLTTEKSTERKRVDLNSDVKPGDIIIIEESFF